MSQTSVGSFPSPSIEDTSEAPAFINAFRDRAALVASDLGLNDLSAVIRDFCYFDISRVLLEQPIGAQDKLMGELYSSWPNSAEWLANFRNLLQLPKAGLLTGDEVRSLVREFQQGAGLTVEALNLRDPVADDGARGIHAVPQSDLGAYISAAESSERLAFVFHIFNFVMNSCALRLSEIGRRYIALGYSETSTSRIFHKRFEAIVFAGIAETVLQDVMTTRGNRALLRMLESGFALAFEASEILDLTRAPHIPVK